jgi:hypothetical protein
MADHVYFPRAIIALSRVWDIKRWWVLPLPSIIGKRYAVFVTRAERRPLVIEECDALKAASSMGGRVSGPSIEQIRCPECWAFVEVEDARRLIAEAYALEGAVKSFSDAEVGDDAYTWELDDGDWGDYKFETVDPQETHEPGEHGGLIRKRWRLVEVTHIDPEAGS